MGGTTDVSVRHRTHDHGDGADRPRVGVLAIQGDVSEHEAALQRVGADPVRVRRRADLEGLDGLLIPGGESTTIGILLEEFGMLEPIRELVHQQTPIWGTCAGMVLLSRNVGGDQLLIGGLDASVDRNAFGRQVDSFETDLEIDGVEGIPFRAIFIRAPAARDSGPGCQVLAELGDRQIVALRQDNILATAFHPELSGDDRLHQYFVDMIVSARG